MSIQPVSYENKSSPPVLVLGLGNPILGDDGIGWRVAELIAERTSSVPQSQANMQLGDSTIYLPRVEVDYLSVGGLALMERMIDYEKVIIIDAITTGNSLCGTVTVSLLSELPFHDQGHVNSAHDTSLQNALGVGLSLGAKLPDEIFVVGIEADQVYDFTIDLSPAIYQAIPYAVNQVMELLI